MRDYLSPYTAPVAGSNSALLDAFYPKARSLSEALEQIERLKVELSAEKARHEAELQRQKELTEIAKERLAVEAEAELRKFEGMQKLGVDGGGVGVMRARYQPK